VVRGFPEFTPQQENHMRGYIFLLTMSASLSLISAQTVFQDLTPTGGEDIAVYIDAGSGPANNGIVVENIYEGIKATGINGGVGILGKEYTGVVAYGVDGYMAIQAYGSGSGGAQGIKADVTGTTSALGITGNATADTDAWGVRGIASAEEGAIGVYGSALTGSGPKGARGVAAATLETTAMGVDGIAGAYDYVGATMLGVRGEGRGYDGDGITYGIYGMANQGSHNYGVYGFADADWHQEAIGVWGEATEGYYVNLAGYFNGDVTVTGSCNCYPSDEKLKKNVQPLARGLETVMALKPKAYEMKVEELKEQVQLSKGPQIGMIAQDVEKVIPEVVLPVRLPSRKKDGKETEPFEYKSVNYVALIPVLIKAIQEQEAKISALEKRLAER
jgi:hypothetical protein